MRIYFAMVVKTELKGHILGRESHVAMPDGVAGVIWAYTTREQCERENPGAEICECEGSVKR